jgi:hypothetical protein
MVSDELRAALLDRLAGALPNPATGYLLARRAQSQAGPDEGPPDELRQTLGRAIVGAMMQQAMQGPERTLDVAREREGRQFGLQLAQQQRANELADQESDFGRRQALLRQENEFGQTRAAQEQAAALERMREEQRLRAETPEARDEAEARRMELQALRGQQIAPLEAQAAEELEKAKPGWFSKKRDAARRIVAEAQANMERVRALQHPESERRARAIGEQAVQALYGLRPMDLYDRQALADAIYQLKETLYGAGQAGVSREQLTGAGAGAVKMSWVGGKKRVQ